MDRIDALAFKRLQDAACENVAEAPSGRGWTLGCIVVPPVETRRKLQAGDVVTITRDHISKVDGTLHFPAGTAGVVKSNEDSCGNVWVVFPETRCKERFGINQAVLELQNGITGRDGLLRLMVADRHP